MDVRNSLSLTDSATVISRPPMGFAMQLGLRARVRESSEGGLKVYEVAGRRYSPLLTLPARTAEIMLSFENLVEAALISGWRRRGVPLQRVRKAHSLAIDEFGDHPFVHRQIYYSGKDLFAKADEEGEGGTHFVALSGDGQRTLAPVITDYLRTVDWMEDTDKPYQWRPNEGGDAVRLHPEIDFGLPNVRRVRTEILQRRFLASESIEELAYDFKLSHDEVERALRYEWTLGRAA
jgi:uncharacterized protein (DUF433 family)